MIEIQNQFLPWLATNEDLVSYNVKVNCSFNIEILYSYCK